MPTRDIYPIYVFLPDMFGPDAGSILQEAAILSDAARGGGLKVGVIFDYFMRDPYHSAPPHVNGADGSIYSDKRRRDLGRGYYPFSWRPGWGLAVDAIGNVLKVARPDFIQQGINADDINWKTALSKDKLYLGYNDTMGLFNQGTDAAQWDRTYVVSGFYNKSLPKARQRFGSAIRDDAFLERCTLDIPDDGGGDPTDPPVDSDLEARVVYLENTMKSVLITFYNIEQAISNWGEGVK